MIDEYLERVKVYLPIDSDDVLAEIRTHLIESAEAIGDGTMTPGSTLMAIERMGEPKIVASEYADSGKKVGPVPAEYSMAAWSPLSKTSGTALPRYSGGRV